MHSRQLVMKLFIKMDQAEPGSATIDSRIQEVSLV